ncbi:CdaR family transcriptional regulator [Sinobaca sp. H24]|uniref:PucR family transcriptional regulator n=1 Tax=Sinobaca sp. H24 TaxID=2923376 RepID=UPI00207A68EC|nr:PucR family transcriptional regulator [Sinobaca sp. H24]
MGISRSVPSDALSYAFEEAAAAVIFNKSKNRNGIVHFQNIGYERLLHNIDFNTKIILFEDHLSQLHNADPVYLKTLEFLISNDRKKQETADALHIHVNTLYKRIKKIQQVLNIDLEQKMIG